MWRLYQHPLCPFSRKVRLVLAEKGIEHELVRENPWDQRDEFLDMNPAGQTPVMENEASGLVLVDSVAICEYFEETVETAPLLGWSSAVRAEIRRLVAWFDLKFYAEVGVLLLQEKMIKRVVERGPPDGQAIRRCTRAMEQHMDYLEWLLDTRRWLSGQSLGLADLAAAAHLSVADYLDGIDWHGHDAVRQWYSAVKSRPSFRPLLADRMEKLPPASHYDKLDF
jgi:glutathione S-transferase